MDYKIKIEGLDELAAACTKAGIELPVLVTKAIDDAATIVALDTKDAMQKQFVLPQSQRTNQLLNSVYRTEGAMFADVGIGGRTGDGVPYDAWWEFGGDNQSPRGAHEREFIKDGRSLWPSIRKNYVKIQTIMVGVIERVNRKYFGGVD